MRKFNELEEKILQILWEIEKGFPKEILAKLEIKVPYNTVLSTIRKLEKDGILGFNKFGKSHQYFPILEKEAHRKSIFHNLLQNYMGGAKENLLSFFMKEEKVDYDELIELINNLKKNDHE